MLNLKHVVLEVTEACPHACLHCYNYWRERRAPVTAPDTLSRTEIRDLIRRVKSDTPLRNVGISGGEPLLRRDLPGIVADLKDEGLNVLVITSGALLTKVRAAQFPPETAFEVTLFSADAALHDRIAGRRGAFRRVVQGLACACLRRCRVAITVVVNRLNAHDVGRALELGVALGGESFLLNRVNLSRLAMPLASELAPTPVQLKQALDQADAFAEKYSTVVAIAVPIPPCVVDLTPYRRLMFGWCARGGPASYYTISHNGLLRPCNHSSAVLGDLRKRPFHALVESRKAARFWAPVPRACRECTLTGHEVCLGGCPAASDECYGTRTRWDPYVDVARGISTAP